MVFKTTGNKSNSVILFFHAMGVTGESSMPVAEKMAEKYYCIMPTSTVYCSGQRYQSKRDEIQQIVRFLGNHGIKEIELIVASSIGADLAMAFLTEIKIPVKHVFFDGGQFAQIGKATRRIMVSPAVLRQHRGGQRPADGLGEGGAQARAGLHHGQSAVCGASVADKRASC